MSSMKRGVALFVCFSTVTALADIAADPTDMGPYSTTSAEYRLPASVDPDVLPDRATEIWAQMYRPTDLTNGPYPLLVFLHGNHGTCGSGSNPRVDSSCSYTGSGTCPLGFVVTPNHLGYSYIADRLASWGYIVVSINANRGITCGGGVVGDQGLNLARGRLILKHLQLLSEWNTSGGTPDTLGVDLLGQLDFSQVGLLGHSRGGEGTRAAYNLYRDPGSPWPTIIPDPITFRGIFEIGPVDGQTGRVLNADGTKWNVLLPMCDGDVSDLEGIKPFGRMMRILDEVTPTQKSTLTVWGTNHNYYNSEWQVSDSNGCLDHASLFSQPVGSPEQRQVGMASAMAFFRANVGPSADDAFSQYFNPLYQLPAVITDITRVDRGFTDSPNADVTTVFEDFTGATGTSTWGIPNDAIGISITHGSVPNHASVQRAGQIQWIEPGGYFQTNWADIGLGYDSSGYQTLELQVSRQFNDLNGPILSSTNFTIQLAMADGSLSPEVNLNAYTDLTGPVGGLSGGRHPILQTARIGLADFGTPDLTQVRGVRLNFSDTPSGAIYVTNIRLSTQTGSGASQGVSAGRVMEASNNGSLVAQAPITDGNSMVIRTSSSQSRSAAGTVEIVLTNRNRGFTPQNSLPTLRVGDSEFKISGYPEDGDIHTLIFALSPNEFGRLASGQEVVVINGSAMYTFGKLVK